MPSADTAVRPLRAPAPGRYRLDPGRTTIRFRTRHLFGLGRVRGEFRLRSGNVHVSEPPGDCTIRAVASAESFDTGHPARDRMVRSASYLDVGSHPNLDFVATVRGDTDPPVVDGTLVARGVAVPLRITVDGIDAVAGVVSVQASAQVDRYAHGITAGRGIAGRRLAITIAAVAVREVHR
jgi:polyisoprenoid-binding protein YceI